MTEPQDTPRFSNSKAWRRFKRAQEHKEIEQKRAAANILGELHGYNAPAFNSEALASCRIGWTFEAPEGTAAHHTYVQDVYIARIETVEGEVFDPVWCFSPMVDPVLNRFEQWDDMLVGGQIHHAAPSALLLPRAIRDAAANEDYVSEYRMGSWTPLIVSIDGECRYHLPAFSICARWGDKTGAMVDVEGWQVADISKPPSLHKPSLYFADPLPRYAALVRF